MSEIPVKIDKMEERWNDWIMPGGKNEYDNLPSSLKPHLRSLARRPGALTPPDKLAEYYDLIDRLSLDPNSKVKASDVAPYLARITERIQGILETTPQGRASLRELPLHIGAVFKDGRNWLQVEHESIPILNINDENQRETYMLENIHAFDVLFKQPESWKPAVDLWLADAKFAATAGELPKETYEKFEQKLKGFMAVTSSVRAMEQSAGATPTYLAVLTGGEKGNLDAQDTMPDYLLHGSPETLNRVLDDPLVAGFYKKVMLDAGLINDKEHRWKKDPKDKDKDLSSYIEFIGGQSGKEWVRTKSELVRYLKKSSEEGGIDKYISEVLLKLHVGKRFSQDARWAAAKLACDAFIADLWTRWEAEIEYSKEELNRINKTKPKEEKVKELELTPIKEWGGNPLKAIIKPSFLPRLKKVYTSADETILNMMDEAFRPSDIFRGGLEKNFVTPSLVTNLKRIARITDAMSRLTGDSMSSGIPSWENIVLGENLPKIGDLLVQVYGNSKDNEGKPVGKEIVGAMMMRLLHTKALATMIETGKSGVGDSMQILFDPQNRERPYLEIMKFLYGPRLDGKAGFIQSLIGGRTRIVIRGNRFGAEKEYQKLYEILQKNNEEGKGISAKTLNRIGFGIDALSALSVFAKR